MVRYPPPLLLSLAQAHLCDTPLCHISRENCAIPHKNKHERVLRYYPLQVSRDMKSIAAGPFSYIQQKSQAGSRVYQKVARANFGELWRTLGRRSAELPLHHSRLFAKIKAVETHWPTPPFSDSGRFPPPTMLRCLGEQRCRGRGCLASGFPTTLVKQGLGWLWKDIPYQFGVLLFFSFLVCFVVVFVYIMRLDCDVLRDLLGRVCGSCPLPLLLAVLGWVVMSCLRSASVVSVECAYSCMFVLGCGVFFSYPFCSSCFA